MADQITSRKQRVRVLDSQLDSERSTFMSYWRDLADFNVPTRQRFTITDTNKGYRKNHRIIDSTPSLAVRTLISGMMSGITSPARPWLRLSTPDSELAEFGPVKEWLDFVTNRMINVFLRSNLYNVLPSMYGDVGVFGTAAVFVEEDFEDVVRFTSIPIGSYKISTNNKGVVNTFIRDFRMTVRQIVEEFAEELPNGKPDMSKFSERVRNAWDNGHKEEWVDVKHAIYPNEIFDDKKLPAKFKKYASVYWEESSTHKQHSQDQDDTSFLRESGFDMFPVLCPRWETTGNDVYGTNCPGMVSLGDNRALQLMQRRKSQAIEKKVNPPMVGPASLKSSTPSILPGDITYLNDRDAGSAFKPAHDVNFQITELTEDIRDHQQRIQRAYYEDLFLMLANTTRREITAREIEEKHEEKLLALGPVLERMNQDLLDPLVDLVFAFMEKQDLLPPAPEELQGTELKVEYVSIMDQAQKAVSLGGLERLTEYTGNLAALTQDPTVWDKINIDQLIDEYADSISAPSSVIVSDEDVAEIKEGRAQARQAAEQAEVMNQVAQSAKSLSQADTSGQNALTELMAQGAEEIEA